MARKRLTSGELQAIFVQLNARRSGYLDMEPRTAAARAIRSVRAQTARSAAEQAILNVRAQAI